MKRNIYRLCIALLCMVFAEVSSVYAAENTGLSTKDAYQSLKESDRIAQELEQETSLLHFFTWAEDLPSELANLKSALSDEDFNALLKSKIPELNADILDLQYRVATLDVDPYLLRFKTEQFQLRLSGIELVIEELDLELTENVEKLSDLRKEWRGHRDKLQTYQEQDFFQSAEAADRFDDLDTIVSTAISVLDRTLASALFVGKNFSNLQLRLKTLEKSLKIVDKKYIKYRNQRTGGVPLTGAFKQLDDGGLGNTLKNIVEFTQEHIDALVHNKKNAVYILLVGALLALFISVSKAWVLPSSHWYNFAIRPFATACIIGTVIHFLFIRSLGIGFESQWKLLINFTAFVAAIRLLQVCVEDKRIRKVLKLLTWALVVMIVLSALELSQSLMLWIVFLSSAGALLVSFSTFVKRAGSMSQRLLYSIWGVIPAMIIAGCLTGYDHLAIFLFFNVLSSAGIAIMIWIIYRLNTGLLDLFLHVVPLPIIKENITRIVTSVRPLIGLTHLLIVIVALSVAWDIYPSADIAWDILFKTGIEVLGVKISAKFLLSIIFVLYGAILISRATQSFLLREVLPRYNAEKGVQISITRLTHYAILTISFLVLLKVLGFELRQITIVGGALGVGIGFGLQAIVNNFVSGLILLFERPVKVGDTIQVGTELGEVKHLGLRATVIQTFDHAEIVVPNASLITGEVTNWTLAERKARLRIQVGVAYGTDVSQVLEVLRACAEAHPMVLSTPKPTALFLAFGASSLDFELRVWIPEYLDRFTAISELNQSIESEFSLQGIEVPFTQTDLHIRSMSEDVADAMRGKKLQAS